MDDLWQVTASPAQTSRYVALVLVPSASRSQVPTLVDGIAEHADAGAH